MRLFCTLFDRNYLSRGLALHLSLVRHCGDFRLVILCLDDATYDVLTSLALQNVTLVSIDSLEQADADLKQSRKNRSLVEFYFTCKPAIMLRSLELFRDARHVAYLDSDLCYFSSPEVIEKRYESSSVALTPHGFPARLEERQQYGRFNAGWVSASSDSEGRRFLEWWRVRCIEWCLMQVEEKRFGDQKYLDEVPGSFADVHILDHRGANAAPWNLDNAELQEAEADVLIDGDPLVFFHFHGLRRVLGRIYDSGLLGYDVELSGIARRLIFGPYVEDLAEVTRCLTGLPGRLQEHLKAGDRSPGLRHSLRKIPHAARLVASRTALLGP